MHTILVEYKWLFTGHYTKQTATQALSNTNCQQVSTNIEMYRKPLIPSEKRPKVSYTLNCITMVAALFPCQLTSRSLLSSLRWPLLLSANSCFNLCITMVESLYFCSAKDSSDSVRASLHQHKQQLMLNIHPNTAHLKQHKHQLMANIYPS